MDEGTLDELRQRLDRIERRLDEQDRRIANLDAHQQVARPQVPAAPPVQNRPVYIPAPPAPPTRPVAAPPQPPSVDTEYRIGAQILPKAGAAIFILGLAYLVSLAVGRGYITPAMLRWGVNALCLAFLGVGQWKREEREEFGQILTGIGSCGLYLNFAAGHIFQKLYSGEALVQMFVALSLVNLGYALWRSSRAFLAIGVLGGLIGALMPLDRHAFQLSAGLHFLIVVPACLIAAKNKWVDMAAGIWLVGTVAILPVALGNAPVTLRLAAILATGILPIAAVAWSKGRWSFDPQHALAPIALSITALLAFSISPNPTGSVALLIYGIAIAITALIPSDEVVKQRLLATAVGIPSILAPFGFISYRYELLQGTSGIFLLLSGVAALLSTRVAKRPLAALAALEIALALATYLAKVTGGQVSWAQETAFLALAIALISLATWRLVRTAQEVETVVLASYLVAAPALVRFVQLLFGTQSLAIDPLFGATTGLFVFTGALATLVFRSRWRSSDTMLWTFLGIASVSYLALIFNGHPTLAGELLLMTLVGATVVGSTVASSKIHSGAAVAAIGSGLGGLLLIRLGQRLLTLPAVGLQDRPSIILSASLITGIGAAIAHRRKLLEFGLLASGFLLLAGLTYVASLMDKIQMPWRIDVACVTALLAAAIASGTALYKTSVDKEPPLYLTAICTWALFSRLGFLLLTNPTIGMQINASVTLSWIVFSLVLLGIGFAAHIRNLRFMSFAVIATTIGKVLLVDLAALDAGIRVAILLVLGMAMLAGGYWYIRTQDPHQTPAG